MKKISIFILLIVYYLVFHAWILSGTISGYDHPFFFPERLKELGLLPPSWEGAYGNGFGQNIIPLFWVETYLHIVVSIFGNVFSFPWEIIQRIGWFLPFLALSIFAPYYFFKSLGIFSNNPLVTITGIIVYSLNTYILMVVAGGQMNVALAYAFALILLARFMTMIDNFAQSKIIPLQEICITGLCLALLIMLDLRLAFLLLLAAGLYFVVDFLFTRKITVASFLLIFLCPSIIALMIHFYWLYPLVLLHHDAAHYSDSIYSSSSSLESFSFAKFENTLSLLHPNWPENIFGKVSFMRFEFLIIPLIAFSSLLFIKRKQSLVINKKIIYFALMALTGAFLAKGTNDPFGQTYTWLFHTIPGFSFFRDPTKWYLFISIAFSVLIPFSLMHIAQRFTKKHFYFVFIPFLLFWLVSIHQVILGQVHGTLQSNSIPSDYYQLEKVLSNQQQFSRTLWVPMRQRYGFLSRNHPAVYAQELFHMYDREVLVKKLADKKSQKVLQEASIQYIIIPIDSEKEIFLKDNRYSESSYKQTQQELKRISWLKQLPQFKQLAVYEVSHPKGHFWSPQTGVIVKTESASSTEYHVKVFHAKKGDRIIFTDHFDPFWFAQIDTTTQRSTSYKKLFNSFVLPKAGDYIIKIYYQPQQWLYLSVMISGISFISVCGILIVFAVKNKKDSSKRKKL